MLTKEQLVEQLPDAEIALVHSSYKSLGGVKGGAQTVVDALVEKYPTIVLPAFNFHSWTEGHYYSAQETRSEMGIITELARKDERFLRTPHPIYSFTIAGKDAQWYANWASSPMAFGIMTVFDKLVLDNALMISIGLPWNSTFTMTHHAEQMAGADYRRHKTFSGIYVDGDVIDIRAYSMFVRKPRVITDIRPAMSKLGKDGKILQTLIGGSSSEKAEASVFFDAVSKIAKETPEFLHRIDAYTE